MDIVRRFYRGTFGKRNIGHYDSGFEKEEVWFCLILSTRIRVKEIPQMIVYMDTDINILILNETKLRSWLAVNEETINVYLKQK